MKTTAELKAEAKEALRGRWGSAILLNLIPTIFSILASLFIMLLVGGMIFFGAFLFSGSPNAENTLNEITQTIDSATQEAGTSVQDEINQGRYEYRTNWNVNGGGLIGSVISTLFMSGISWTFLDILRRKRDTIVPFKDATRGFNGLYIGGVALIALLTYIFVSLWSLLLLIPGIVKSYAYSQSQFIYYDTIENTGRKPKVLDTITASRRLMDGHKGRLFWLDLSFIGWHILAVVTLGIGYLWLNPYISATKAAFYENLPKEAL